MDLLTYFLDKYRNLVPPDSFLKEAIVDVIFRQVGILIDKKSVSIRGSKAYIKASPVVRNQIFLQKQAILRTLNQELDKKAPQDIL